MFEKKQFTKFIIVSQDFSGLGFAKILLDESDGRGRRNPDSNIEVILALEPKDDEDNLEKFWGVGTGIVDRVVFEEIYKERTKYKDWMWIFDQNHHSKEADNLRSEGYEVFGGQELADKMEHDRNFGLSLIKKAGLHSPESKEFQSIEDGLSFLYENSEKAYVFKPDEQDNEAWVTTSPENNNDRKANEELYKFLACQEFKSTYILQERKKGVELNIEFFAYKGTPFFAHANFESKRKDANDLGRMIGCSQDIEHVVPVDSKICSDTLSKLIKLPEFKDYTGFLDMNVIVADNEYWFLEFCARFGYNSHPNLFLTLLISPMSEIMSDFVNGDIENFGKHFRAGFGSSITLWIDKPVKGLPITFDDENIESRFYHFDTYKEEDDYYIAGYANEVGIICAHDYDLKSSAEECIKRFEGIHYSGKTGRVDLDETDYKSNPQERLTACNAMRLFEI